MKMIVRNGILSNLRAKGRTALFTLLILTLTVSLTLGLGMWSYAAGTLASMDRAYTSVALVEHMGERYPDGNAPDPAARAAYDALAAIDFSGVEGVELWERSDRTLALAEGYVRTNGTIPYADYVVAVVSSLTPKYAEEWGSILPQDMPDDFLAVDWLNNTARVRRDGGAIQTVPFYIYDGNLFTEAFENGAEVQHYLEGDPPAVYVQYNLKANSVMQLMEGEERTTFLDSYRYDSSTDLYEGMRTALEGYAGLAGTVLYSAEGKDSFAVVVVPGATGFQAESGKKYLVHGRLVSGASSNRTLALGDIYEGCDVPPYLEVSGSGDPALTDSLFARYAETYRIANNYVQVEASADVTALEPFQQGTLFLEKGRFPEAGERGVCVVSGYMARQMGLALGDTLDLSLLSSDAGDRFRVTERADRRPLTVVGVTNALTEYDGCVWVSDGEGGFGQPLFGYSLGRAVLDNDLAREAADAIREKMPEGVRVTFYDQGYAAVAKSLETMETTAMAITVASACGALAVLFLFAYLFVGRQRETVEVLISLGTPAGKQRLWLLSGGALIAAVAAGLGALIGSTSLKAIIRAALTAAQRLYAVDLRYSEAVIGVAREAAVPDRTPVWPGLFAGGAVFLTALLLCAAFLSMARRRSAPKRGKTSVRLPKGGTSLWGGGPVRFALLSAKRGGWRSAVVPATALVLSILLGILAAGTSGWSGEVERITRETALTGSMTSTNGRQATDLAIPARNARQIWQTDMLADMGVSIGFQYWFHEDMPNFGAGAFAQESRADWIAQQPELVAVNDLSAAGEFFYGEAPEVTWLEGWDESRFASQELSPVFRSITTFTPDGQQIGGETRPIYPCLVGEEFLSHTVLGLGDTTVVGIVLPILGQEMETALDLQIVGTFPKQGTEENIYVPLSFWCRPEWLTGEKDLLADGKGTSMYITSDEDWDAYHFANTNFSACRFTLRSAGELDEFRDKLEELDFSQVGKLGRNRSTLVLRDQTFTETVGGLGRYITFSRILFPVLLAVIGLLGFVISWLMVSSRRMEFAIMRGLGAKKSRVFFSFFLEQGALCLAGCLPAALLLLAGQGGAWAPGAFLVCYLAGGALSILLVGRTNLMDLLSERE